MTIAWSVQSELLRAGRGANEARTSYARAAIHYFFSHDMFGPRVPNSK
jgi:hypothetical protein